MSSDIECSFLSFLGRYLINQKKIKINFLNSFIAN